MPNSVQALLETQWKCAVPECIQNGGTAHLIVFGLITGPLMWSINPHDTNHANDLARVTDISRVQYPLVLFADWLCVLNTSCCR